jgi:hypothetical protein
MAGEAPEDNRDREVGQTDDKTGNEVTKARREATEALSSGNAADQEDGGEEGGPEDVGRACYDGSSTRPASP